MLSTSGYGFSPSGEVLGGTVAHSGAILVASDGNVVGGAAGAKSLRKYPSDSVCGDFKK